jgi:D-lyxose ketol-isomerase
MKRSEVNAIIEEATAFMTRQGMALPPFASWGPRKWARLGREADEIRDCHLGWDITDFGSGYFPRIGLVLLTLRNGHPTKARYRAKTYCEKAMVVGEGQVTPMHFHWSKAEDIINRGGGNLLIRFYRATPAEGLSKRQPVTLSMDGVQRKLASGAELRLRPGESVCITRRIYHTFQGEKGKGPVLVGEVSKVNDDEHDNRFLEPIGRFPAIEEDVMPTRLLCMEYPR